MVCPFCLPSSTGDFSASLASQVQSKTQAVAQACSPEGGTERSSAGLSLASGPKQPNRAGWEQRSPTSSCTSLFHTTHTIQHTQHNATFTTHIAHLPHIYCIPCFTTCHTSTAHHTHATYHTPAMHRTCPNIDPQQGVNTRRGRHEGANSGGG